MKPFQIVHITAGVRAHGLYGYKEVIETLYWGLEQLGYEVTYATNEGSTTATNIIFGAQMLPPAVQDKLPPDTIIYNLEQRSRASPELLRGEMRYYATRFQIWDYSTANIEAWNRIHTRYPVKHVPIGYAPILTRIPKSAEQDIDVLIYGLTSDARLSVFNMLSQRGLRTLFVSGLYGQARDELIARSKIVLNLNMYGYSKIFEIVRVSYLLANMKAVVADRDEDTFVEPDIVNGVRFSRLNGIVDACEELLADNSARQRLEELGYALISQRDIREILKAALDY